MVHEAAIHHPPTLVLKSIYQPENEVDYLHQIVIQVYDHPRVKLIHMSEFGKSKDGYGMTQKVAFHDKIRGLPSRREGRQNGVARDYPKSYGFHQKPRTTQQVMGVIKKVGRRTTQRSERRGTSEDDLL